MGAPMNRRPEIPPGVDEALREIEEPRNQDVLLKRAILWKTVVIVAAALISWFALAIAGFFIVVSFP